MIQYQINILFHIDILVVYGLDFENYQNYIVHTIIASIQYFRSYSSQQIVRELVELVQKLLRARPYAPQTISQLPLETAQLLHITFIHRQTKLHRLNKGCEEVVELIGNVELNRIGTMSNIMMVKQDEGEGEGADDDEDDIS